jgi:branched-chain amino acid transport system ATP-binding protein
MVALGRALMGRPALLLLDEPSGGLAPAFVEEIAQIMRSLRERGTTMMLVEQNIRLALTVADRFLILRDGRVSEHHDLRSRALDEADIVRSIYL